MPSLSMIGLRRICRPHVQGRLPMQAADLLATPLPEALIVGFDVAAGPDSAVCCRFVDGELQSLDVIDYDDEAA
jgi:hypothetical protein